MKQILLSRDTEDLKDRVTQVVEKISQTSKNDLIHYVSLRKCVLELFEKSLRLGDNGKYQSEGDVHDIVMPRRKDTDQVDYDQHNLWILDERLNFTEYVASDKPLDGKIVTERICRFSVSALHFAEIMKRPIRLRSSNSKGLSVRTSSIPHLTKTRLSRSSATLTT